MLSSILNDYDFWVSFTSNMFAGVLLTLVFGLVMTSVMSHFSERRGVLLELFLVAGLAAEPADDEVIQLRVRRCRGDEPGQRDRRHFAHSRPQYRRTSHSPAFKARSKRNARGMFQRSSTWRSTLPASEKLTASGSRLTSPTAK